MLHVDVGTATEIADLLSRRARERDAIVVVVVGSLDDKRAFARVLDKGSIVARLFDDPVDSRVRPPASDSTKFYVAFDVAALADIARSSEFPLAPHAIFRVREDGLVVRKRTGLQKCLSISVFLLATFYAITKIAGA